MQQRGFLCLFSTALIEAENTLMDEQYYQALKWCRSVAREQGIDAALREHCVDVLVIPCSGWYTITQPFASLLMSVASLPHSQRVDLPMHGRISLSDQSALSLYPTARPPPDDSTASANWFLPRIHPATVRARERVPARVPRAGHAACDFTPRNSVVRTDAHWVCLCLGV